MFHFRTTPRRPFLLALSAALTRPLAKHYGIVIVAVIAVTVSLLIGGAGAYNLSHSAAENTGGLPVPLNAAHPTPLNTAQAPQNAISVEVEGHPGTSVTVTISPANPVLISEFRLRGPQGVKDEFIELYNNTDADITVSTPDGSDGWAIVSLNGSGTPFVIATIPNGTLIPARSHYLVTNASAPCAACYSLTTYALGDHVYTADLADSAGIALFNTAFAGNWVPACRLDAVGFSAVTDPLYREGAGLSPGDGITAQGEYSFVRKIQVPTNAGDASIGLPVDTDDNAADFVFVSTTGGTFNGVASVLGAPGPQNLSGPLQRGSTLPASLIEPSRNEAATPNQVHAGSGPDRTLSIRRRFTNNTATTLTRLRFRVVDVTTLGSPDNAPRTDLRLIDSTDFEIETSLGALNVKGTMLEQPPAQSSGGGLNSSLSVALPEGGLAPGASIDVQFLLNVIKSGESRFHVVAEAEPPVTAVPVNQPPSVNAGADQRIAITESASLSGSADDDGLPRGGTLALSWSQVSGPGTVTFSDASSAVTTASFSAVGDYVLRLEASDVHLSGNDEILLRVEVNQAPTVDAGADQAITLPEGASLSGTVSDDGLPAGGRLSSLWSKVSGPGEVSFGDPSQAMTTASFSAAGSYLLRLTASDSHLTDSDDLTVTVIPPNQPPTVDAGTDHTITLPGSANLNGTVSDDGLPSNTLTVSWTQVSGPGTVSFSNAGAAITTASFDAAGSYVLRLTASDTQLSSSDEASITVNAAAPSLPPDPAAVAPPVDQTVATSMAAATAFLYTGSNPIQTGVAPETIDPVRVAVVRGRVITRDGAPLSSVKITVKDHPEFGSTMTREDGAFDMAVNGGGLLTVNYEKQGLMPVQRQENVPWQDYSMLPDVVMIPFDSQVTAINLNASTPVQVAQGSPVTDEDGTRQATLLFAQGMSAEMEMPDGSKQPLTNLHVRATEYTVGANGPAAMPGELPPTSGYTYAVEFSVDEAVAAGARSVRFSRPVISYIDNFIGFPVGGVVPSGFYDRDKAAWVPSDNGRVIKILSISNGMAELDVNGSNSPASAEALAGLGVSDAERQRLAGLYQPGQSLWRVPITHFTPWDCNWPFGPPPDAVPPNQPPPINKQKNSPDDPCITFGSIIECQNQTLGQAVGVTGTQSLLSYTTERVPGRIDNYTLEIPLSGASVPASLKRIELIISVAGRVFRETFAAAPNQKLNFTWDGKDAYGRTVQGKRPVRGRIEYVYSGVYFQPDPSTRAFGLFGDSPIEGDRDRQEITISQRFESEIGSFDARGQGLGGWTLDAHHAYDPIGRTLYLGDGSRRSASGSNFVIDTVALSQFVSSIAVAPDGSVYFANDNRVRRLSPDGSVTVVAGGGDAPSPDFGDGGPATQAQLLIPEGIAVGPDGSLYIIDVQRIRRVSPDGIITRVAGRRPVDGEGCAFSGDGGPATEAQFCFVGGGISVGPDGSIYIPDGLNNRIRQVSPDGIVTTIAGRGPEGGASFAFSGDGGPATEAQLNVPNAVEVAPDGSLYISDSVNGRIRRVRPDGIIETIAGAGGFILSGDGGPATNADINNVDGLAVAPDGTLYLADRCNQRIRQIGPDGIINTVAGSGAIDCFSAGGFSGDGGPATQALLRLPRDVAVAPDGSIYIADFINGRIRRVGPQLPGFSRTDIAIASEDGGELYQFDGSGRHLRTLSTLTGAVKHEFNYNTNGLLTHVRDGDGQITTIERDASGAPTAIVAPGGQRTSLALDANGYLASITNPAREAFQASYTSDGLLTSFTDPAGGVSRYGFDTSGQLVRAEDPAGGVKTLSSEDTLTSRTVNLTTALGRTTTYKVERLSTGAVRRINSRPTGARTEVLINPDGTQTVTHPDGTRVTTRSGPDSRFRLQAPALQEMTITAPDGRTETITNQRTVSLNNPNDPLSLNTMTDTVTINGNRTSSLTYDAATRTVTNTSAEGRRTVSVLDAQERVIRQELAPDVAPIIVTYDDRGRVTRSEQGGQFLAFSYDEKNRAVARTDAAGRRTQFAYDEADRVTQMTLPGGAVYRFTHDSNGNRIRVIMPSGAAHSLGYTPVDLDAGYTPPDNGENGTYARAYDRDRALARITLPSGRIIENTLDSGGRPTGMSYPEALTAFGYLPNDLTDRVGRITRTPNGVGTAQEIIFGYSGSDITTMNLSGAAQGQFSYTYDNNFFLTGINLTSGSDSVQIPVGRDRDGAPTRVGPFTLTRGGPGGAISRVSDDALSLTRSFDTLARLTSRTHTVGGQQSYQVQLTYDNVGRIDTKLESAAGFLFVYQYTYDADGQLTEVNLNGNVVERYAYDANGNRTSHSNPDDAATYDSQDRLTQRGSIAYQFNSDGFLTQRGTDTFQYSARGELLRATIGDRTITYSYDGLGRRVSRTDSTGTYQYLYGEPGNFTVTAVRDPGGVLTTFFYDEAGYLLALERGGARFYVATDQVGSPRVVSNAAGHWVKVVEYDSFGNVIADSDPLFDLPVGYAGGLEDRATGLVRFGLRDYDPLAGRWTARDPVLYAGGQGNLFAYVNNDPVNNRDPLGLFCINVTLYNGYGGGVELCIDENGASICFEVGFGLGAGVGLNNGGLANSGTEIGAELSAKCGPVGVGVGLASLDSTGCLKGPVLKGNIGPVTVESGKPAKGQIDKAELGVGTVENGPEGKSVGGGTKCSLEGKLSGKICVKNGTF